jgi:hypothetical protein
VGIYFILAFALVVLFKNSARILKLLVITKIIFSWVWIRAGPIRAQTKSSPESLLSIGLQWTHVDSGHFLQEQEHRDDGRGGNLADGRGQGGRRRAVAHR